MSRARDNANLGAQAGSGLDASDITSGVLPVGVTGGSGLTALGTVALGNLSNTAIVYPAGHVIQTVQGDLTDTSTIANFTNAASAWTPSANAGSIANVKSGNNILINSVTPLRAFTNGGNYIHGNFSIYWFTGTAGYAALMDGTETNTTSPYHGGRVYFDGNFDGSNMPGQYYSDVSMPINFLHRNVAAGTHYYKIYFQGSGTGYIQCSYDELPGTMHLSEIQT